MSETSIENLKIEETSDSENRSSPKPTILLPRKRSLSPKSENGQRKKTKNQNDSPEEQDNKSESSHGPKSSNVSSSTPDPASTPDEDRSDLGENGNLEHVTLFWFTEAALRMHDNPGLKAAVKGCKAVSNLLNALRKYGSTEHGLITIFVGAILLLSGRALRDRAIPSLAVHQVGAE